MIDEPRYAIYYTPPAEHPLTRAAARWLGRSAFRRATSFDDEVAEDAWSVTTEPRRYGFHATLKAPFRLAAGRQVSELEQALSSFVAARRPCVLGPLQLDLIGSFFALVPRKMSPTVLAFASSIVEAFDGFRAAPTEAELRRRLSSRLNDIEREYVARWGYPYVFDRYQFHMTLTEKLSPEAQSKVRERLEELLGALAMDDYTIDALTLFEQKRPGADFHVRSRFKFMTEDVTSD